MTPLQLEIVRNYWGLNPTQMSLLLGIGINQWRNYEAGDPPNRSNGMLLRFTADPLSFRHILTTASGEVKQRLGKDFTRAMDKATAVSNEIDLQTNRLRDQMARDYVLRHAQFDSNTFQTKIDLTKTNSDQ